MNHISLKKHLYLKIALGIAITATIFLLFLLTVQYQHVRKLDYISMHRKSFLQSLHGSGHLTAADAGSIQFWMTFDYIDQAFSLPTTYLQANLDITDNRYPRMTIAEYAKNAGISNSSALANVESSVSNYFLSK